MQDQKYYQIIIHISPGDSHCAGEQKSLYLAVYLRLLKLLREFGIKKILCKIYNGIEWLLYITSALMSSMQNVCKSSLALLEIQFSFDTVMSA